MKIYFPKEVQTVMKLREQLTRKRPVKLSFIPFRRGEEISRARRESCTTVCEKDFFFQYASRSRSGRRKRNLTGLRERESYDSWATTRLCLWGERCEMETDVEYPFHWKQNRFCRCWTSSYYPSENKKQASRGNYIWKFIILFLAPKNYLMNIAFLPVSSAVVCEEIISRQQEEQLSVLLNLKIRFSTHFAVRLN